MNNKYNSIGSRDEYDRWVETLNTHDIAYLLKMCFEECGELSYSDFDLWLFERWLEKNG